MKSLLLPALCALAALSLFTPDSQAQAPASTTGTGTGTSSGIGATAGAGARHRGAGSLEQRAREIIAKYDKDGDHALNATELAAFFEALHQRMEEHRTQQASNTTTPGTGANANAGHHPAGTPQEHAAKAIEKFDKNGDGKLEVGELTALLRALREHEMEHRGGGAGRTAPATTTTPTPST